jgi:hypothetical protein
MLRGPAKLREPLGLRVPADGSELTSMRGPLRENEPRGLRVPVNGSESPSWSEPVATSEPSFTRAPRSVSESWSTRAGVSERATSQGVHGDQGASHIDRVHRHEWSELDQPRGPQHVE